MRRNNKNLKILILLTVLFSLINSFLFSAGKKDKSEVSVETTEEKKETTEIKDTGSTKLPSSNKNKGFFYQVESSVLADVENGSPESLNNAMNKIRKNEADYTESEKVLIYVSASIMEIVWNKEKISWSVYPVLEMNSYTGAINSVKNGVFDSSTGNVDFLSTFLPSLVIFTSLKPTEKLINQCEVSVLEALKINPESVVANYVAGYLFEKKGDYQNAEKYFEKAYEKSSNTMQLCVAYSKVLSANGKNELASKVVNSISSSQINDIQVLKQSAYVAFNNNDLDKAEDFVARVLQQTPNDLEFVLFRAKIFIQKNDYIHAVSLLDMYAKQNEKDLEYLILRTKVQLDWSKNTSAATETVEKALKLYPESEDALMLAAKISSITDSPVAGKYADELANLVLEKNPGNTNALLYALDGLIQRENWNNAFEISSKIIKETPNDAEVVKRHVKVCIQLGKKNEALEVSQKAYNSNKNNEIIIESYVFAYRNVNNRDLSIALINNLMNQNPSQQELSFLYYQRSYLQISEDSVFADLLSSLIANPRNSDSLFRLYEIYFEKKDYKKAQYYLKQVVAINPNDTSLKKKNEALTQLIK